MSRELGAFPVQIGVAVVTALGLLLALALGFAVGKSDVETLLLTACSACGVFFLSGGHRYVWQTGLLIIFLGFGFRPTGFAFGALELTCGLCLLLVLIFAWQKRSWSRPQILDTRAFSFMRGMVFLLLAYIVLHFIYNYKVPYRPGDFALSNALKSYFGMVAPFAVLYYFSRNPSGLIVRGDFFKKICRICLIGLVINLVLQAINIARPTARIFVPIINATPNVFALRTLGPLAMLLGATFITAPSRNKRAFQGRLVAWTLLLGGAGGAMISGGRASPVWGLVLVCGVLMWRRKIGVLVVTFTLAVLAVAMANTFSGWINTRANPNLQRSLQWILIEKNANAEANIESSSKWRRELAHRALEEWMSSARIFWFGRATYSYGLQDELSVATSGGFEAGIEVSLRRGATHNLLTDLLVAYGLIGCALFCGAYLAILGFLWNVSRSRDLSPPAVELGMVCAILSVANFLIEVFGAGSYRSELFWFLIILLASLYQGTGLIRDSAKLLAIPTLPLPPPLYHKRMGSRPS